MEQAIAQAQAQLVELAEPGLLEGQTSDSPASAPDESAVTLRQQIQQWQKILKKLE